MASDIQQTPFVKELAANGMSCLFDRASSLTPLETGQPAIRPSNPYAPFSPAGESCLPSSC
jgi:hypothetical protein